MRILLSRHGNTFSPGDPVVWAGSTNDLPLVAKGREQARALADALERSKLRPDAVYCGPLKRTLEYAELVSERLGLSDPVVDERINELDYGEWTGKTSEQVAAKFGRDALEGWDERCEWPKVGKWGGSETEAEKEVRDFVRDLRRTQLSGETALVVTSNGRLRYFLKLVPGEFERRVKDRAFKVGTGRVCKLARGGARYRVEYWNEDPATLAKL